MEISSSTYYGDPKQTRAEKEAWEADLRGKIEQIRVTFPRTGYRMFLSHLKRAGVKVGERRLRQVLSKFNLQFRHKRKFVHTTYSNHAHKVYPNLIEELGVNGVNQVWTADLTYIRIDNGFVYLAVILDLYSRKVIGWQVSKKIDGQLALDALKMAIAQRSPPRGVIHHSDRGVQYLCDAYTKELHDHGFHVPCSRKGNPYDNAWTESFMKTLKYDEIYMYEYRNYLEVIERLPQFIEGVYNKNRPHSALGYATPVEYEEQAESSDKNNSVSPPTLRL